MKLRYGKPVNLEEIAPQMKALAREFNILLLYLFGSYTSGEADKLSDIDIAFLSREKFDLDKTLRLISELQDIFQDEAIDLVDLSKAPLSLIHRIIKEGICLYACELRTKIEFESKNETLYYDTAPLRREYFKELERRIKDGTFGYR